ncbi:hypothetical protein UWK_03223 [Desulfocapsa sulfexigens DSM 10523]|uniref:Uncharacterized protein n=1 Tax=Desulfocapsa sulfexigens (strain DSM 10523 / SB164P1) TaxID=1167006 RepID=M1PJL3_DESSD|nr:hypothetical protein [Desulfocapsa sulfexigens]AGF79750.1 hypothetical protein UWK_03223 [Desulfocapsa sulfexigens DSM 10523]
MFNIQTVNLVRPRCHRFLLRNQDWSESSAVGRKSFTEDIQQQLASRAQKRSIVSVKDATVLKEPEIAYSTVFDAEKGTLSHKNTYYWRQNV